MTSSENPLSPPPIGQWSPNTAQWDTWGTWGTHFGAKQAFWGGIGVFLARMNGVLTFLSMFLDFSPIFNQRRTPTELRERNISTTIALSKVCLPGFLVCSGL